jgi:MFS family permease
MAEMLAFVHQVAFAIDSGIERIRADVSISIIGLASIAGRYFFGWIGDRLRDAKYAACIGFAAMALGMLVLLQFRNVYGLYGCAALFGFGYGSISTMMPFLIADRFGISMLGTIYGMLTFFVVAGASLGPILGGYIYDKTGSYDLAWQGGIGLLILVTFVLMTLKKDGWKT